MLSLSTKTSALPPGTSRNGAQGLVHAGGVLHEVDAAPRSRRAARSSSGRRPAGRPASDPSAGGRRDAEPAGQDQRAELRCRRCAGRARAGGVGGGRRRRRAHLRLDPALDGAHIARLDVARRPGEAAVRGSRSRRAARASATSSASIAAQRGHRVDVADLVVGGAVEHLDAEEDSLAARFERDVGDERVVGVGDEDGAGAGRGASSSQPVGQSVDLAVAVELVTEEVGEHDRHAARRAGASARRHDRLVDLEQREPRAAGVARTRWRCPRAGWRPPRCGRCRGRRRRSTRAAMLAVVVLPLVPVTMASPSESRRRGRAGSRGRGGWRPCPAGCSPGRRRRVVQRRRPTAR